MARRGGLLLLLCAVGYGGPEAGAPAFEEGMKVIRGLLERGRCAEGRKRLSKLLDEHPKAPYVLGRRVQVEELARELAFGATVPAVEPKEMIAGELLQWNPRDGTIKLRYEGGAGMKDWARAGSMLIHPAPFRGPHSVTIKGKKYPADTTGVVIVCYTETKSILVVPGIGPFVDRAGTTYSGIPATIELQTGDDSDTIGGGGASPVTRGRPYTIGVVVNAGQVSCYYGNKAIARANKATDHWGSIAIADFGDCEIELSGKVETSWIQGLVDKERQARLAEFSRRWEPKDDLPAWLFEEVPVTAADNPETRAWPMEVDKKGADLVERAMKLQVAGEASAALKLVDKSPDALPETVRDYLRGILLHDLGRYEEAAASCKKVREKDQEFIPALLIESEALVALGRADEALAIYRALLARFPRAANLHADAALFLGAAGRWEEADKLVGSALSTGIRSKQLEDASRVVHKAVNGPAWPKRHDYQSAHYVVASDMDGKICFEASQILEQAFAVFTIRLERAPPTKERFKVFLFSGEAGYQTHVADLLGGTAPHSAGLYAPALRQLFIWNLPERNDMMKTVRHEGFHQYLHRIMDDPPLWFNEGLAEYFEEVKIIDGKWTTGATRVDHLQMLQYAAEEKQGPARLRDFLFLDDRAFMEKAFVNYPQSWAFIHFLLHTSRENRELFDRFWDSFKRIPAHADAIREALGDRRLEDLEAAFDAHVAGLR